MSEVQTVPLEELAELPEFYHPIVSPDGSQVAFYYDESGRNELYVLDRETGDYEQLSDGEVPRDASWYPRWDATGDRIFFHRDEAGDEQNDIYAISLDGEVEPIVEPDGQGMLLDSTERYVLYGSDEGEQLNLYRCDLDSGETEQLTEYRQPVQGGGFSPSGDRIAYVANESETLKIRTSTSWRRTGARSGGWRLARMARRLASEPGSPMGPGFSSRTTAMISGELGFMTSRPSRCAGSGLVSSKRIPWRSHLMEGASS